MYDARGGQRTGLKGFVENQRNRRLILLTILVSALLGGIVIGKEMAGNRKFLQDEKGRLVSVEKKGKGTESCTLHVKASRDGVTREEDVTLVFRGKIEKTEKGEKDNEAVSREEQAASSLERDLDALIKKTEADDSRQVFLPNSLPDGTKVQWCKPESASPVVFLLFPMVVIGAMYSSYLKKNRDIQRERTESVRRSIPVFTDQIMILLSCGLIFPDAFRRIAEGYAKAPGRKGFFETMIVECQDKAARTNMSLMRILNEKADAVRIREFTRIVGYISENQYRGVDLTGKLESSGRELWEERKKQAEEKGKLAETKLTMPLALLLLVLILVTAAPAIIQVKGV